MLGTGAASILFAVALLASGQNSTLTGTLAGQMVMEGFLNIRLTPWLRRLITRLIAIIPAVIVIGIYGESGANRFAYSQSGYFILTAIFCSIPLVTFTSDRKKMGELVIPKWMVDFKLVCSHYNCRVETRICYIVLFLVNKI